MPLFLFEEAVISILDVLEIHLAHGFVEIGRAICGNISPLDFFLFLPEGSFRLNPCFLHAFQKFWRQLDSLFESRNKELFELSGDFHTDSAILFGGEVLCKGKKHNYGFFPVPGLSLHDGTHYDRALWGIFMHSSDPIPECC